MPFRPNNQLRLTYTRYPAVSAMRGRGTNALCALLVLAYCAAVVRCDARCVERFGTCKDTSLGCSGGSFTKGLCDGAASRQCCVPDYSSADSRCGSHGGTCQRTTVSCAGDYQSGMCGGPADRKCCVPSKTASVSTGSCSEEVKELACQLANSAKVVAAISHPSKMEDNAYAKNNLNDVCDGKLASRSHYTCDECNTTGAPGGFTCLSPTLLRYLIDLQNRGKVKINEVAGGCHVCKSFHYSGLAVDLHVYEPGTNKDRRQEYLEKCDQFKGWHRNYSNHIHCQFNDGAHPNW